MKRSNTANRWNQYKIMRKVAIYSSLLIPTMSIIGVSQLSDNRESFLWSIFIGFLIVTVIAFFLVYFIQHFGNVPNVVGLLLFGILDHLYLIFHFLINVDIVTTTQQKILKLIDTKKHSCLLVNFQIIS